MLPYHWDDRERYAHDAKYLDSLYESILLDISSQLNDLHGTDHSLGYWRILLGPWLLHFIPVFFDRWTSIKDAEANADIDCTIILGGRESTTIPNNTEQFMNDYFSVEWNHQIYSMIISQYTNLDFVTKKWHQTEGSDAETPKVSWNHIEKYQHIAQMAKRQLNTQLNKLVSGLADNDTFLFATYLPRIQECLLNVRMRQLPVFRFSAPPPIVKPNPRHRLWRVGHEADNQFERALRETLPRQIPTDFLEGYTELVDQTMAMPWPTKPKMILTNNAFQSDDVFKAWTADKVEHGSTYVIGQHGGFTGLARLSSSEDHEVKSSDCWMSWGWSDEERPSIRPTGYLKRRWSMPPVRRSPGTVLLVTTTNPLQSRGLYSTPLAGQWLNYFEDQYRFVDSLPAEIQDRLLVRLCRHSWGWEEEERWLERFPDVRQNNYEEFRPQFLRSEVAVISYNGTAFLETLAANHPTVIFWDPANWELRESAERAISSLEEVSVFHRTPDSAAKHLSCVWPDVKGWWYSKDVQDSLNGFRHAYCNQSVGTVQGILSTLKTSIGTSDAAK